MTRRKQLLVRKIREGDLADLNELYFQLSEEK